MKAELKEQIENLQNLTNPDNMELLTQAFDSFRKATAEFQEYYRVLEGRIKELNLELDKKNQELEKNLREKEEVGNYLTNIIESMSTGIIAVDFEGTIKRINRSVFKILGKKSTKKKSLSAAELLKEIISPNKFNAIVSAKFEKTLEFTTELKKKSGNPLIINTIITPAIDSNGNVIGGLIIIEDVTRIRELEEQAARSTRLMAMGQMAASIAHQIRNPLGSIELFSSLLKKDLQGDNNKQTLTEHISTSVKRMNNIITNLLLFAKTKKISFKKINLKQLIDESISYSIDMVPDKKVKISQSYPNNDTAILGDADLLKQVFLNLFINSIQAVENSNSPKIDIRLSEENGTVNLLIKDNGFGIPADKIKHIFDPFFTLKEKGTGLGLSIAHNIIIAHNGTISAKSKSGKGSEFLIKLPRISEQHNFCPENICRERC